MSHLDRRLFLQGSLAGAASLASLSGDWQLWAEEKESAGSLPAVRDDQMPKFDDGDPNTLFLTWQRDPTTTVTATWVGVQLPAEKVAVEVAEAKSQDWKPVSLTSRHPYPAQDLYVYRAEATGLIPGAQYKLRIGRAKKEHRFQTMPAKATNTFQYISGGDSGGGSYAEANNRLAARQDPMFVLMTGDIAYDNGVKVDSNLRFMRHYRRDMLDSEQRMIPLVPAIGNHEVTKIRDRPASPFFDALYGGLYAHKTYATLDFGDYLSLVLLDSGHMASVDGEQTAWLEKELAARSERPHVVVTQHVPSYPSYREFEKTGEKTRRHWVPLFEKHNVDVVLEHHDHTFKRTHPLKDGQRHKNGIVYLGDGSWGVIRSLHGIEPRPYMATASSNFHISLHRLEGEQQYHLALTQEGRVADVHLTTKRPRHVMGRGA